VAGRIDDIDLLTTPMDRGVLGHDGDAFFALQVVRIHDAVGQMLVGAKCAGLPQHHIHKRGFSMIDVRDNGDIANIIPG